MTTVSLEIDRYSIPGLAAILLWSTTVPLVKSLSEQVGALTAGALVYLLGGAVCLCVELVRGAALKTMRTVPARFLFGCGSLFVLYMATIYAAIGLTRDRHQTMEIGLINYLWPATTILFSLPIGRKKATWLLVPGTLLALAGAFLAMTDEVRGAFSWGDFARHVAGAPLPYALAFVAAVSWGVYSNLARRWLGDEGEGTVPFFMLATSAVLFGLRWVLPESTQWQARSLWEILALGVATSGGYIGWDLAMRRGNLVLVAAASYLTPLLSTLVITFYLGARAGGRLWLGCVLVIAGSFLSWMSVKEGPPGQAASDPAR